MTEGLIELTKKALHRLKVVEAVCEKRLKQGDAARQLGVTGRQVKRLVADYRRERSSGDSLLNSQGRLAISADGMVADRPACICPTALPT